MKSFAHHRGGYTHRLQVEAFHQGQHEAQSQRELSRVPQGFSFYTHLLLLDAWFL